MRTSGEQVISLDEALSAVVSVQVRLVAAAVDGEQVRIAIDVGPVGPTGPNSTIPIVNMQISGMLTSPVQATE